MGLFGFLAVGLLVGLVTRAIAPGTRTAAASLVLFAGTGAFVGTLVGTLYYGARVFEIHRSGTLAGIAVTFIVLLLAGVRAQARRRAPF